MILKYIKDLITRILTSIILILIISIIIKNVPNSKKIINKYLFEDNIKFTKINELYKMKFGNIIPESKENSELVFSNDLLSNKYEKYDHGIKILLNKNYAVTSINGGVVVYKGYKEEYGNTIIIQGNDGVDYIYGSIINSNLNLYDYIEKNTILGETEYDYLYLVLKKNNEYIQYEDI